MRSADREMSLNSKQPILYIASDGIAFPRTHKHTSGPPRTRFDLKIPPLPVPALAPVASLPARKNGMAPQRQCCECTCENAWGDDYACSVDGAGFDCQDPSAPCLGEEPTLSYEFVPWGYDDDHAMSYDLFPSGGDDDEASNEAVHQQEEAPLPTLDNAVEVGTKTEVGVSATAYDTRAGTSNGEVGCGEVGGDGCAPQNTRDGIISDIESRWSCSPKLLGDNGLCQIEYNFAEPQDIVDIQVAFWQGGERTRTLKVCWSGMEGGTFLSANKASGCIRAHELSRVLGSSLILPLRTAYFSRPWHPPTCCLLLGRLNRRPR